MAFRSAPILLIIASLAFPSASLFCSAQAFVVGEKSAMADVSTEFHPTRVELSSTPISERGRRELVRNLEAEQGFAHRALPLGDTLILMANGNLIPGGDAYKEMLYKKGESAAPGDRVAITTVSVEKDRIVFDLNGGPHLKHRFLRHIEIGDMPLAADDGTQVTGCRVTLVFEGGIPDISAPEVKALLDPIIDFGVKTSAEAFANSLPVFLKDAVAHHDVLVGMNRKMVLAAMGVPLSKERELIEGSKDRHYEEWIYGQVPQTVRFVRFVGDRVVQVRVAALGQAIAVHDKDEMQGYLAPEDINEVALGDDKPGDGEATPAKPPTILKPGEIAPGSSRQVLKPVVVPPATQVGNDPVTAGSAAPAGASTANPAATGAASGAASNSKFVEYGTL